MSDNEWKEPLGCLLWILVFFFLFFMLEVGGDLIDFVSNWLKEHQ